MKQKNQSSTRGVSYKNVNPTPSRSYASSQVNTSQQWELFQIWGSNKINFINIVNLKCF